MCTLLTSLGCSGTELWQHLCGLDEVEFTSGCKKVTEGTRVLPQFESRLFNLFLLRLK